MTTGETYDAKRALPAKPLLVEGCLTDEVSRSNDAFTCEFHGRAYEPRPRQPAEFAVRKVQAGDGARHTRRLVAESGQLRVRIPVGIEEHVAGRGAWRRLPVIDSGSLSALGVVDEHKAAAADVACPGYRHREGEADRNGGIDGIAAVGENIRTNSRGYAVLGCHHPGRAVFGMMHRLVRRDRGTCLGHHRGRPEGCRQRG